MTQILAVDDEDAILDVIRRMLSGEGLVVVTARNGDEAIEHFRHAPQQIDCVLLDVNMPGLSAEETFSALRGMRPDIPIIIGSGRYPDELLARLPPGSVSSVATKPYRIKELVQHIQAALAWRPAADDA